MQAPHTKSRSRTITAPRGRSRSLALGTYIAYLPTYLPTNVRIDKSDNLVNIEDSLRLIQLGPSITLISLYILELNCLTLCGFEIASCVADPATQGLRDVLATYLPHTIQLFPLWFYLFTTFPILFSFPSLVSLIIVMGGKD